MDVYCTTCSEPWDTHHLWHEAIHETDLSQEEADAWFALTPRDRLQPKYREAFCRAGWEFGRSVINVTRCPACPENARPDPERLATKASLEELLGEDEDGLASTFNDHRL
jgi:hypothetical protein